LLFLFGRSLWVQFGQSFWFSLLVFFFLWAFYYLVLLLFFVSVFEGMFFRLEVFEVLLWLKACWFSVSFSFCFVFGFVVFLFVFFLLVS